MGDKVFKDSGRKERKWIDNKSQKTYLQVLVTGKEMVDSKHFIASTSHDFVNNSRFTWLKCVGVPLHAWNYTFCNIIDLWGELISIDDKTLSFDEFCHGFVIILTYQVQKIDEVIELSYGEKSYAVRVYEVTFEEFQFSQWMDLFVKEVVISLMESNVDGESMDVQPKVDEEFHLVEKECDNLARVLNDSSGEMMPDFDVRVVGLGISTRMEVSTTFAGTNVINGKVIESCFKGAVTISNIKSIGLGAGLIECVDTNLMALEGGNVSWLEEVVLETKDSCMETNLLLDNDGDALCQKSNGLVRDIYKKQGSKDSGKELQMIEVVNTIGSSSTSKGFKDVGPIVKELVGSEPSINHGLNTDYSGGVMGSFHGNCSKLLRKILL
ncbi:hypothetical protein REPUB_Repub03eG0099600 [Reevesia pubescens]